MGTTRVKLIDLASNEKEDKASKKKAQQEESKKAQKVQDQQADQAPKQETEAESDEAPQEVSAETSSEIASEEQKPKEQKKKTAPAKIRVRGKKYQDAVQLIDKTQSYPEKEALALIRKTSTVKFDPTVEIHLNVTDKSVRGKVAFPHAIGGKTKEKKYLIFSEKSVEGKNVVMADDKTIADIESGKLKPVRDFDAVITSAKFMPQLARVAKVLGPRGMMPNPKNGTITDNPAKLIEGDDNDSYEYRTDPTTPVVHTKIGKLSYKDEQLSENLQALIAQIGQSKIKKAVIKSTMSPAVKLDIATIGK